MKIKLEGYTNVPEGFVLDYLIFRDSYGRPIHVSWGEVTHHEFHGDKNIIAFTLIYDYICMDYKPAENTSAFDYLELVGIELDDWIDGHEPDFITIYQATIYSDDGYERIIAPDLYWHNNHKQISSKGGKQMILYLEGITNSDYVPIDSVIVTDWKGNDHILTWAEGQFGSHEPSYHKDAPYKFSGRYKGVFIDEDDTNGRANEIQPFKIKEVVFDEADKYPDPFIFRLLEINLVDNNEGYVLKESSRHPLFTTENF